MADFSIVTDRMHFVFKQYLTEIGVDYDSFKWQDCTDEY